MSTETNWNEIHEALGRPFPRDVVEFLPKGKPNKAGKILAIPYIDARAVMDRLDKAAGPGNWSFDWSVVVATDSHVAIKGTLTVLGVSRSDAGEGATEDEPIKSAVSDTLKRCAVHFGIGRYLYSLPPIRVQAETTTRNNKEYHSIGDLNDAYRQLVAFLMNKNGKKEVAEAEAGGREQEAPAKEGETAKAPKPATQGQMQSLALVRTRVWGPATDKDPDTNKPIWPDFQVWLMNFEIDGKPLTKAHISELTFDEILAVLRVASRFKKDEKNPNAT